MQSKCSSSYSSPLPGNVRQILTVIILLLCGALLSDTRGDMAQILEAVEDSEYEFSWHPERQAHFVPNRAQNLRFKFEGTAFSVEQRVDAHQLHWTAQFELQGFGNGIERQANANAFVHSKNVANVQGDELDIIYENNREDLRQNFEVKRRQPGNQPLQLRFHVETTFVTMIVDETSNAVLLYGPTGVVLSYDDLKVFDAKGQRLEARMKQSGRSRRWLSMVLKRARQRGEGVCV